MKFTILTLAAAFCLALVSSHPLPEDGLRSEALDRLVMAEADSEAALRSKRTIGILRQLFPDITQRIEAKVNSIISEVIRVLGPVVLRNLLGGGAGSGGGIGGGNTPGVERTDEGTSVVGKSPFDDEDEDDESISTASNGSKVSISLPTFPPDEEETSTTSSSVTIESRDTNISTTTTTGTPTTTTPIPSLSENEVTTTL